MTETEIQELMIPLTLWPLPNTHRVIEANLDLLLAMGFTFASKDEERYIVTAVPKALVDGDYTTVLNDIIENLIEDETQ
jgi:DNA mismatch repair ATPase MutL